MKKIVSIILLLFILFTKLYSNTNINFCSSTLNDIKMFNGISNNLVNAPNQFVNGDGNTLNGTEKLPAHLSDNFALQQNEPSTIYLFALDTVIMPGVQFGAGKVQYKSTTVTENIIAFHANTIIMHNTFGVFLKANKFRTRSRKGFYTTYVLGLDYVMTNEGSLEGPWKTVHYVFPNISYGVGYSYDIGNHSFLRLSLDVGIKYIIGNFKISVIF